MATRRTRKTKRAGARVDPLIGFDALAIEGGLLSPEWLSQVAQLKASQQAEADYDVPRGLNLRDEIGRYWRVAQAAWTDFSAGTKAKADPVVVAEAFVTRLLKDGFGFTTLVRCEPALLGERLYPVGFSALDGRVPVVIAPAGLGLDALAPVFGDGTRRRSAFGLAQEYLNAQDGALWGLVTDGVTLRIVRDNASLTRPAWIEVDVARLFTEERYADFAALWLLMHASRFGRAGQPVTACPLEAWRTAGREEGTRAREHLRRGVEDALLALGQGFLSHPDNTALRTALHDGSLTTTALFNQLLRLVYRLIFLLTVEERGLLHPDGTPDDVKALYAGGYSLRRLRERSVKRSAHDRFVDLWQVTRLVTRGVARGEPRLGLPALAGLFAADQCQDIDGATLDNRALLTAMFKLSWLKDDGGLARVNWRDMGPEELGSVYESLLELVPQVTSDGRGFAFAGGDATNGNARKTSGSYYTPDSLVQVLLDSALEPVIADTVARHPAGPIEALLELSIVDPACGSGHFLLAAARRLATHVARLQAGGTPSAAEYRHALRQVVGRCIYGVDLNPMAVELCKVSLWMEAVEPGLPLTFLNAHIQHGNALLGTTPELMKDGIPDAAWEAIEGDDKKVATALKKRNKEEGRGLLSLALAPPKSDETAAVAQAVADLEAASDADLTALSHKESRWSGILDSTEYRHQKQVADAWCAAFVWPKQPGPLAEAAPTVEVWRRLRDGSPLTALTASTVAQLAEEYHFFHWHLQFPRVFERGGFDVVLGNPPWDEIQFEETAWFASRDLHISGAQNAAERSGRIAALDIQNPALFAIYLAALRLVDGTKHFITSSASYPAGASGKLNTATLFSARGTALTEPRHGAFGLLVPTGIATDKGSSDVFADLMSKGRLRSLLDFVNQRLLFKEVRPHQHFCLLTGGVELRGKAGRFAAFLQDVSELKDLERYYWLTWDEVVALNPEAHSLSLFESRAQAEASRKLSAQFRPLGAQTEPGNWRAKFQQGTFNMASASDLFRTGASLLSDGYVFNGLRAAGPNGPYVPLFDAKMARQFEWRAASLGFSGNQFRKLSKLSSTVQQLQDPHFLPEYSYWVPESDAEERLATWKQPWLLGFKDVTGVTSTRLAAFAFVPRMGFGHKFPLLKLEGDACDHAFVVAWLNGLLCEWFLRQRMQGVSLTWYILSQVPIPARDVAHRTASWDQRATIATWVAPRVAELSVTSFDLADLAHELVGRKEAFGYDQERRFKIRTELDAALFFMSGFSPSDALFVIDSLDKVAAREISEFGEFRSRKEVPSVMVAMAEAQRTGTPYQTRLDPPPADPRVAHPESTRPPWAKKPS
jgi:hypothetical protein